MMRIALGAWMAATVFGQSWVAQTSGTTASMRGVYAVSATVVWASGTEGSWLLTVDGGETWRSGHVEGAADLDFRGVRGVDERTAYLMSSGPGGQSRIYKTGNGGRSWICCSRIRMRRGSSMESRFGMRCMEWWSGIRWRGTSPF